MDMNRFKNPTLRKQYDLLVQAFLTGHRDIGTPERRCRGNSLATHFWRGYDNTLEGLPYFKDRASRQLPVYAAYRAGQD